MSSCVEPGIDPLPTQTGEWRVRPADSYAFRQFYLAHFDEVMGLIIRFGIVQQDAEDLAQRVFLVALRHLGQDGIQQPKAWLRAVAIRIVHEHFRWWKVRRAGAWLLEQSWAGRTKDDQSPERDALATETLQRVRRVLYQMSQKLRDALVLLDIEGISSREAAQLLGVPHNTLRSRHILAREEFKQLWQRAEAQRMKSHD